MAHLQKQTTCPNTLPQTNDTRNLGNIAAHRCQQMVPLRYRAGFISCNWEVVLNFMRSPTVLMGDRGGTVAKVLCYKSEGRWFDPS